MLEPDELWRCDAWLAFTKTRDFQVIKRLMASVIRESKQVKNINHGAHYIYKNFYLKGLLVARWPQDKLAVLLGTTEDRINQRIQRLDKIGVLKKIKVPTKKNTICYYHLGGWQKVDNKQVETWFLYEHFLKIAEEEWQERKRASNERDLLKAIADATELFGEGHECVVEFQRRLHEFKNRKKQT